MFRETSFETSRNFLVTRTFYGGNVCSPLHFGFSPPLIFALQAAIWDECQITEGVGTIREEARKIVPPSFSLPLKLPPTP